MKAFKEYFLTESKNDCIAVDLDGTLAYYNHYEEGKIGKPIPKMLKRIKKWLNDNKKVIIFTARADNKNDVKAIKKWLKDNDLPLLKITNIKTPDIIQFWDDRAVSVEKNDGQVLDDSDTMDDMVTEGVLKKSLPYIAAGLTGLGGAFGTDYALKTDTQKPITRMSTNNIPASKPIIDTNETSDISRKEVKKETPINNIKKTKTIKSTPSPILKNLIPAIAQKETGHLPPSKRDVAIGDQGRAFGRYQVHKEAVMDVNRIFGTTYSHRDMFNPHKAEDVLVKYLTYWGKYNNKYKGVPINHKYLAAMWNGGGPKGFKNKKALIYAKDVLRNLYASN